MNEKKHYFQLKGKNAEKIVHNMALKTFMVDWCYLNPMAKPGKELCDLLVVFDDVAIVWQVKDLKLDKNGKYKKSEVDKNLKQLAGAKRQLFDLKRKIELHNPRREKDFFDTNSISEIYLISVLLGEGEDYYSALEEIKNSDVHVFSRSFTQIVLNELDTISDFCDYLKAKEKLFLEKKRRLIVSGGEEELLGVYIRGGRSFEQFKKFDEVIIEGNIWKSLKKDKKFIKKKKEDKISYGWDSIINRAHEGSSKYEFIARELARANRFKRRVLSKSFMEAHIAAHKDNKADLFRRIMSIDGITYCFLFADDPEPDNRELRKAMLYAMCYFARGKFLKNKKVIGIATEKKFRPECSYDFVLLDKPDWTKEDQKKASQLQEHTGMFLNVDFVESREEEYPG